MVWFSYRKGASGFSTSSTAEEVTRGIDASGLLAIVTGASSGVGAETARVLALRGVHVFMCVRNVEAGKNVKEKIIKDNPKAKVDVLELDLASMSSVRKCASEFNSLNQPLNILINNAGVMACPYSLSKDGIELQFATNHLGHFLLTSLLLDKMKSTAKESGIEGKIINLSSWGHRMAYKEGTFEKINDESRYEKWKAYGQSKLANILHVNQLSRQFKEEGVQISANAVHPGAVATNLGRHVGIVDGVYRTIGKFIFKNSEQGAATSCYVALHPQVRGVTGKYFANSNEATPSPLATDAKLAEKLRDISMELVQ